MFIPNKYTVLYYRIIENAQIQNRRKYKGDYFEKHHIIPKSIGGTNEKLNLVLLTFREHFVCHRLLVKMTEGMNKTKMNFALYSMCRRKMKKHSSRQYELAKIAFKDAMKHHKMSDETRAKISRASSNMPKKSLEKRSIKMKSYIWVTNGLEDKRVIKTDIPENFYPGRMNNKRNYVVSEEQKEKLRSSRKHTQIEYEGKTYRSLRDAERITGISRHKIKLIVSSR
jgi:hypothetical protein